MRQLLGRKVRNDVVGAYGVTLIPANAVIDEEALELIVKHRVSEDAIVLESDAEAATSEAVPEPASDMEAEIVRSVRQLKEIYRSMRLSRKVPVWDIRSEILPIVQGAAEAPDIYRLLEMIKGKDDYLYEHNIGVAVVSTLIGRWMNLSETELSVLAMAALLHDVGNVRIPEELLTRQGKLTSEEYRLVQQHTVYGYELLRDATGLNHRVALAALQHHEREDGCGYPFGLTKERIDPLSSIVAVADVFHAMISRRPYSEPRPFHLVMEELNRERFGRLNPHIVSVLVDHVCRKLVGQQVRLTDGRTGKVVYVPPSHPPKPLVRVDDELIDLSRTGEAGIQAVAVV